MKNERLVLDNMGLAHHTAFMFRNCGIERDDLKFICTLGLYKAALTYEEGKAVKFSTYAATVMRNEVLMELRKKKRRDLRYGGSLGKEICEGVSWVEVIPDPGTLPDEFESTSFTEKGGERVAPENRERPDLRQGRQGTGRGH